MTDTFRKHNRSLTTPPEDAAEIVPNDTTELAFVTRALYVGAPGDVRVEMIGGAVVSFANLPAGALLPVRVTRVFAAGTTASGLIGLW